MDSDPDAPSPKTTDTRTSHLIEDMACELSGDRVSVDELKHSMEGRGLGLILLVLSLPICIPNIPGISTLFGLLILAPAIQLMLGHQTLWLPGFMRRWTFKGTALRAALNGAAGLMRRIEYLARPRLVFLTTTPFTLLIGVQVVMMALILLLPMPGANILPGISVALTGLALLQRDGLSMLLSIMFAAISCAWVYYGGKYVIAWTMKAYQSIVSYIEGLICSFSANGTSECLSLPWTI